MYDFFASIVRYKRILLINLWQFYEFSQDKVILIQECLDYSFVMDFSEVKTISIHVFSFKLIGLKIYKWQLLNRYINIK